MLKKFTFSFLILFFYSGILSAQDIAENALQKFSEDFPQEKIHLLLNKKAFVVGESIYFKGMIIDGFKPSLISTTLFVELYDENKKLLVRKTVPILLGEAFGNIPLANDLKENIYYLRAYTTWSTNFNEGFEWLKPVPVYNPKSTEKLILNKNADWNVTVHPESGNFLNKIKTKVAVRMHTKGIYPSKWSGYVVDEKNPTVKIAEFNALDENVGLFEITPEVGKNYQLIATDANGKKKTIEIPIAKNEGIYLEVQSQTGAIIYTPRFDVLPKSSSFKIVGQINNRLVFSTVLNTLKSGANYKIPTNNLVNGILQLVILNDQNEVIAERLAFVDAKKLNLGKINVSNAGLKSEPKSLNTINIGTKSAFANFSALVEDGSSETTEDENSLLSTMWLTGDISSKINRPAQYFTPKSNAAALDALLMTEKWQRFDWKQIIMGNFPKIVNLPYSYIAYSGKAIVNGAPAKNKVLNMVYTAKDAGTEYFQTKTDDQGMFLLDNMIFEEPFDVLYAIDGVVKDKDQEASIVFQPKVNPSILKSVLPESGYILTNNTAEAVQTPEVSRAIDDISFTKDYKEKVALIEEVLIKANSKERTDRLNKKLSSPNFKGINETVFDLINDYTPTSMSILTWLEGRVSGLTVTRNGFDDVAKIRGANATIYINEFPADTNYLSSFTIDDIALIKVIKPPFQGRDQSVILIYLREGKDLLGGKKKQFQDGLPGLGFRNLKGYDKNEAFPIVDYQKTSKETGMQDTRLTLYWNPYIQASREEAGTIKFYNNDIGKSYNITIFGYDQEAEQYVYFHDTVTP